jgi:hypothetical protein
MKLWELLEMPSLLTPTVMPSIAFLEHSVTILVNSSFLLFGGVLLPLLLLLSVLLF